MMTEVQVACLKAMVDALQAHGHGHEFISDQVAAFLADLRKEEG